MKKEVANYWQEILKLYYPVLYKKLNNKNNINWEMEFAKAYQAEYKAVSVEDRRLISILRRGDLKGFIQMGYTLDDISQTILKGFGIIYEIERLGYPIILSAIINGCDAVRRKIILDHIFTKLVIPYYRKENSNELDLEKLDSQKNTLLH